MSNVLDGFALIDSTKMISKIKLHLLGHLQTDIRRFGPMVGSASEIFECFNAVFRAYSVLSNWQAPSRDIANQLGKQEGFKHRVSGGWWKSENGEWIQAGSGVTQFISNQQTFLENLGWSSQVPAVPGLYSPLILLYSYSYSHIGKIRLCPAKKSEGKPQEHPSISWGETKAAYAANSNSYPELNGATQFIVQHLVAKSSDICQVGTWVVAHFPQDVCLAIWDKTYADDRLYRTHKSACMVKLLRFLPRTRPVSALQLQ